MTLYSSVESFSAAAGFEVDFEASGAESVLPSGPVVRPTRRKRRLPGRSLAWPYHLGMVPHRHRSGHTSVASHRCPPKRRRTPWSRKRSWVDFPSTRRASHCQFRAGGGHRTVRWSGAVRRLRGSRRSQRRRRCRLVQPWRRGTDHPGGPVRSWPCRSAARPRRALPADPSCLGSG